MRERVAIVTGAAGGIGRAIVEKLALAEFSVFLVDQAPEEVLEGIVAGVTTRGGRASFLRCDISLLENHTRLLLAAIRRFAGVSCLVNCAGVSVMSRGDILEVSETSYDRCQSVNTKACFFLTQRIARHFLDTDDPGHHRSIVNVSSCNSVAVAASRSEYCVSKAALSMVTKAFAVRLAPEGVGVYEVRPGVIDTEMTRPYKRQYAALIAGGLTAIPRLGTTADVARAVHALASGELTYTCGQVIDVDGGLAIPRF